MLPQAGPARERAAYGRSRRDRTRDWPSPSSGT